MALKVYYDLIAPPSRALFMFLKAVRIPFESCPVALRKGAHLTDEYRAINRFQKVPVIDHDGFKLMENVAIIRYLAREYPISDHWYPNNTRKQALVDEYLEWQHNNTRDVCTLYCKLKWLHPFLSGNPPKPEEVENSEQRVVTCLDQIEELWLSKTMYMTGSEISVADLCAACELELLRMSGFDPLKGHPRITAWMDRVRNDMRPHYDEAHKIVYKIIETNKTNAPWEVKN